MPESDLEEYLKLPDTSAKDGLRISVDRIYAAKFGQKVMAGIEELFKPVREIRKKLNEAMGAELKEEMNKFQVEFRAKKEREYEAELEEKKAELLAKGFVFNKRKKLATLEAEFRKEKSLELEAELKEASLKVEKEKWREINAKNALRAD